MLKPSRTSVVLATALAAGGVISYLLFQMEARGPSRRISEPTKSAAGGSTDNRLHELKVLEQDLGKKPAHTPVLFRMAQLNRDMGKHAEAAKNLREILLHEPKNLEARLELGRVLYESGDVPGAIAETKRILELNPQHTGALYNLGAIHANLDQAELARQYWTRAVAVDPQSESGRNARRGLEQLGGSRRDP